MDDSQVEVRYFIGRIDLYAFFEAGDGLVVFFLLFKGKS
jgi:hypothetical protein